MPSASWKSANSLDRSSTRHEQIGRVLSPSLDAAKSAAADNVFLHLSQAYTNAPGQSAVVLCFMTCPNIIATDVKEAPRRCRTRSLCRSWAEDSESTLNNARCVVENALSYGRNSYDFLTYCHGFSLGLMSPRKGSFQRTMSPKIVKMPLWTAVRYTEATQFDRWQSVF